MKNIRYALVAAMVAFSCTAHAQKVASITVPTPGNLDSRVVTLPGIGHVPMEEAPARSVAPVLDFLRR